MPLCYTNRILPTMTLFAEIFSEEIDQSARGIIFSSLKSDAFSCTPENSPFVGASRTVALYTLEPSELGFSRLTTTLYSSEHISICSIELSSMPPLGFLIKVFRLP